jgi:hypothetical protein
MTDYSAQGKTRPHNVVDLNNCRTHQSYYTALSRSASAAGTCIVQGFDARMVTGGASGALRQEFRELEILDDVVRLQYEGKLSDKVVGDQRHVLIHAFRLWKGDDYVPGHVHKAIRWGKNSPFHVDTDDVAQSWESVHATLAKKADSKKSISSPKKRKCDLPDATAYDRLVPTKKLKSQHCVADVNLRHPLMPHGTIWSENSCAYDSVVTILYSIWSRDVVNETVRLQSLRYAILNKVVASFTEHQLHHCSLEDSRDSIRQQLMAKAPNSFPWGAYIGIDAVFEQLLQTPHAILTSERICKQGHNVQRRVSIVNNCVFNVHGYTGSTQYWMSRLETQTGSRCRVCANSLVRKFHLSAKPPLFVMSVAGSSAHPSLVVQVRIHDEVAIYNLCGITYF